MRVSYALPSAGLRVTAARVWPAAEGQLHRLVALSLTEKGRALFAEIAPLALAFEQRFLEKLSPEEAATFRRLVGKLLR